MTESLSYVATIAYLPAKFFAYAGVARYGIGAFLPSSSSPWRRATVVAAIRVLLGLAMALPLLAAGEWLQNQSWNLGQVAFVLLAYALFYLPLRWLAWSLVAPIVNPEVRSVKAVALCAGFADAQWRGLGVLASCSIDLILVVVTGTVPIGKFFC